MNELFVIAEIIILLVFYVWITHTWTVIYQSHKDRQNKPEIMSSEDDINIK